MLNPRFFVQETQFLWFWVRFQNLLWLQLRRQGWPHNFPRSLSWSHAWISWKSYAKSQELAKTEPQAQWETWKRWKKKHQLHLSTKQHAILSVSSALPSHSSHSSFSSGSRGRSGKLEGASCRKLLQTLVPHGTVARCGKILTLSSFHKVQQQVPHLSSIELCPVAFYTYGFHDSWFCTAGKTL